MQTQRQHPSSVMIRIANPMATLYPSAVLALLCAFWVWATDASPETPGASGIFFSLFFFANLSIQSLRFTRKVAVTFAGVGGGFLVLLMLWPGLREFVHSVFARPIYMNHAFYLTWLLLFGALLGGLWVRSRVDYWELTPTELTHRRGGYAVERWPLDGPKLTFEATDLAQYALLRAGTLTIEPTEGDEHPIVLENALMLSRTTLDARRLFGKSFDNGAAKPGRRRTV